MAETSKRFKLKKLLELNQFTVLLLLILLLAVIIYGGIIFQHFAEADANRVIIDAGGKMKERYETYKLDAEIRQIRSDTSGNLFWLKLVALLVSVGGAIGGYLYGQTRQSQERINSEEKQNTERLNFEHRKDVDAAYQQIVQELSAKEDILRTSAAVKLGSILKKFPAEWNIKPERQTELKLLTKQILAAALAIEKEEKVLKTITIALVLDTTKKTRRTKEMDYSNVQHLDLSLANAADAYWAKADFSNTDFYKANLQQTSFRDSTLTCAMLREADLRNAVFINATCIEANFKMANLRNADLGDADFTEAIFENAKVYGVRLTANTKFTSRPEIMVDISPEDEYPTMIPFDNWFQTAIRH